MNTFTLADNIISPLGTDTHQNFDRMAAGKSGISLINDPKLFHQAFYGAQIDKAKLPTWDDRYTFLENLFINSIQQVEEQVGSFDLERTILILSTTKGNIDQLTIGQEAVGMIPSMAEKINNYFGLQNTPIVVSNACISGVSALLTAQKLIRMGRYDHAIVSGGDILSRFTISGFHSLMAIDQQPCKPYDKSRAGISLGEGCATIFISKDSTIAQTSAEILGGAQTNDANHISGPSRTGEGLKLAVEKACNHTHTQISAIDYINAHGTATLFNDEMESIAFNRLSLSDKPLNSLKGYFGHTLGAAGVIESILAIKQMNEGKLMASLGYQEHGVSEALSIIGEVKVSSPSIILKTVSGFGGCNGAILFKKA